MKYVVSGKLTEDGFPLTHAKLYNNHNEKCEVKALFDTGAAMSHISLELAEFLRLDNLGIASHYNPVNGEVKGFLFKGRLEMQGIDFGSVTFKSYPGESFPFPLILGLEFIRNGVFVYSGLEGDFSFTVT